MRNWGTARHYIQWDGSEIDRIARPLIVAGPFQALGVAEASQHKHRRGKLVLTVKGTVCCVGDGEGKVSVPDFAVWVPAGTLHTYEAGVPVVYHEVFIDPDAGIIMPGTISLLPVSALLREAVDRAAQFPALYRTDSPEARVLAVIRDEIMRAARGDREVVCRGTEWD